MQQASHKMLPDGRRLHLHHGPIDLIVEAWGAPDEVAKSYRQAIARFQTILTELVAELPLLRSPVTARASCPLQGTTARRMWRATAAHLPRFVTPMAAVAGAVADEVLAAMAHARVLRRAYVNNGGDIALHLAPKESFRLGLVVDPSNPRVPGATEVSHAMPVRGVATSGRHGRSLSLGIADSVTVLAATAADADAAATLIANSVDLPGHRSVRRMSASSLDPDSDLGDRLVTVGVGPLSEAEIDAALAAGVHTAEAMIEDGLLHAAVLVLADAVRLVIVHKQQQVIHTNASYVHSRFDAMEIGINDAPRRRGEDGLR
jgi:ApbE superfamily uncharacterized protein (UPF0280 family)